MSGTTVYVGGRFDSIGGQPRNNIAALDATTGSATAWNPNANGYGNIYVNSLAVSGTTVYVGGLFDSIGGQLRSSMAALDATTGTALAWNPNPSGGCGYCGVSILAVSGATVYAGGNFGYIGGQPRKYVAALDATTGTASAWNANLSGNSKFSVVSTLAVSGTTVYFSGHFGSMGGEPRYNFVALDATTGTASAWNPNADNLVNTLVVSGKTVYAGGWFTRFGGVSRPYFASWVEPISFRYNVPMVQR